MILRIIGSLIIIYCMILIFNFLKNSPLRQQQKALRKAKENVKLAEIQRETIVAEKQVMKIQSAILDEELEEFNEITKKSNTFSSKE